MSADHPDFTTKYCVFTKPMADGPGKIVKTTDILSEARSVYDKLGPSPKFGAVQLWHRDGTTFSYQQY